MRIFIKGGYHLLLFYFLSLGLVFANSYDWQGGVVQVRKIASRHAEYRLLQFSKSNTTQFLIHAVVLSPDYYRARILDYVSWFTYSTLFNPVQVLRAEGTFLAINGGYFTPEYNPVGLAIINGKRLSRFSHSELLTGLVLVDSNNKIGIISSKNQLWRQAQSVIQAGPFLIQPNGSLGTRGQKKEARRTVLGLSESGQLLVLSTTEVTLLDLAQVLKQYPTLFGIQQFQCAINLDGGSSNMFLLLTPERSIVIPSIRPIRNVLIFESVS